LSPGNKVFLSLLVRVGLGLSLCGQQTIPQTVPSDASWSGVLRGTSGSPISGSTVELVEQTTAKKGRTAVTQPDGRFAFHRLPPLRYTLFVIVGGHRTAYAQTLDLTSSDLTSSPGAARARDVILTLTDQGALSMRAAEAETETGVSLSSHAVSELPLNKRDFSQLLLLAAGSIEPSASWMNSWRYS
jgi:hypothetical protein